MSDSGIKGLMKVYIVAGAGVSFLQLLHSYPCRMYLIPPSLPQVPYCSVTPSRGPCSMCCDFCLAGGGGLY